MTDESIYPISSKAFEILFYILFLGWVWYLLIESLEWSSNNRLFPVVAIALISMLIALRLLQIVRPQFFVRFRSDGPAPDTTVDGTSTRPTQDREKTQLLMVGWTIALPVALYYLGFVLVIPSYIFLFHWYFTRDVKTAILVTGFSSLFLYGLFIEFLNVRIWRGVLF